MIEDDCKTWTEVSEMLYLFHGERRKWSQPDCRMVYLDNTSWGVSGVFISEQHKH